MKEIQNIFAGILAIGFLVLGWYFMTSNFTKRLSKEEEKFKEMVGLRVVLDKDTLRIMDYSILKENFILNNGNTISYDFAKKLIIVP